MLGAQEISMKFFVRFFVSKIDHGYMKLFVPDLNQCNELCKPVNQLATQSQPETGSLSSATWFAECCFLVLGKDAFAECFFLHSAKSFFAECYFFLTLGKENFKAYFEAVN